jgi:hypothetical protein
MKFDTGKQYKITFENGKTSDGVYWIFLGEADNFPCSRCGKDRNKIYEFLGYTNFATMQKDVKDNKNYNGWNYHEHWGSECIKHVKIEPV